MFRHNLLKSFIILCLFFPGVLFAERVTLKSGKKVEGKITEKTDQYIKLEVDGAPLYFERKFIARIDENKDLSASLVEGAGFVADTDYFETGLNYGAEARFQEAENEFKKGLSINSNSHNLNEASRIIEGLKNGLIKQDYAVHVFKGSHYLINSQLEEAASEFKSALQIDPNPDLYYYLGVCNYSLGKYGEAIDYLKKASAEIKEDSEIYYSLGISYYAQNQYPEALTYLQRAVEINPEDAESYSLMGLCYFLLGQLGQAKEELYKSRDLFRKKGDYLKAADVETFLKQSHW